MLIRVKGGMNMACTRNNICFGICFILTITPGSGVTSVVNCDDVCGTSPTIEISPTGSVIITLPLTACFAVTLNNDLSVNTVLTDLFFFLLHR
jgi:hypothetical protein